MLLACVLKICCDHPAHFGNCKADQCLLCCRPENFVRCLSTRQPNNKATALQGAWLAMILQLLRLSGKMFGRCPHAARAFAAELDSFLSSKTSVSIGKASLLGTLYNSTVSSIPTDFGPLASQAGLCLCQIIILVTKQNLPDCCDQLFSTQELGIIQDACGQLQMTGSIAGILVRFCLCLAAFLTSLCFGRCWHCNCAKFAFTNFIKLDLFCSWQCLK